MAGVRGQKRQGLRLIYKRHDVEEKKRGHRYAAQKDLVLQKTGDLSLGIRATPGLEGLFFRAQPAAIAKQIQKLSPTT